MKDPSLYQPPPHDIEMEQSILATCLMGQGGEIDAVELIRPMDFYNTAHQIIFKRIVNQVSLKQPTDLPSIVTVLRDNDELERVGGAVYLSNLLNDVPIASNLEHYCGIAKKKKQLRQLIEQCNSATKQAFASDYEAIDRHFAKISEIAMGQKEGGFTHIADIIDETVERCEMLQKGRGITGVPTGYPKLDKETAGFQPGDLIIVAGRPSMGKTAFALNVMRNQCNDGKKCAFFSLEMADPQIGNRLLAMEAEVEGTKFRSGKFKGHDWKNIMRAAGDISQWGMHIDDTAKLSYQGLIRRARQLHTQVGLDAIYIDYLGFIDGDKDLGRRDLEVGSITRNLKAFAKDTQLPVVLLVQLSRACEQRGGKDGKRPILSDLRDSGDIEQDADLVCFLYRDEFYYPESKDKGKAELIIRKQRNGPIGTIPLQWDAKTTLFRTLFLGEF